MKVITPATRTGTINPFLSVPVARVSKWIIDKTSMTAKAVAVAKGSHRLKTYEHRNVAGK
jgi:hypothetical protein